MLYDSYRSRIDNILDFAMAGIDADDLAECIRTGETSPKYDELQKYLDSIKDNVDLDFLYIIVPLSAEETDNIQNVIAAMSSYEKEYEPENVVSLNELTGDSYSSDTARQYLEAYDSGVRCYFEEAAEWGRDYTGLQPIYDSEGRRFAALCVDISINEINALLRSNTITMLATLLIVCAVFSVLFLVWASRNITTPIKRLETSVVKFANTDHNEDDPDSLRINDPDIHTDNEVEALAAAVTKMSDDMREYVRDILVTKNELAKMNILANKDALTHVGNKNSYEHHCSLLQKMIDSGTAEFAVIMADINDLKSINDNYGHDKGDIFIQRTSQVICDVFAHSPVFRVGGDEFTVILSGNDYKHREKLMEAARKAYEEICSDGSLEPWERAQAALGITDFDPAADKTVSDVANRADRNMYIVKNAMKSGSGQRR